MRKRSTKAEVEERRNALHHILEEIHPATVRQVFYQATVRGVIEKTEGGYNKVQEDLVILRRAGVIPYEWLADNTRWMRKPRTFDSVQQAIKDTAAFYRKSLWSNAGAYVEIWLEKDALSGVIVDITAAWDVPLMVARGYASLSFLHSAAKHIQELDVPTYIYHLGDYDPSGVNAANKIEETLREMAPNAEIYFQRLAVLPEQISEWNLPTRPTKASDSRAKTFESHLSVELDAIEPGMLRELVDNAIAHHVNPEELRVLQVAEESEREFLATLAKQVEQRR